MPYYITIQITDIIMKKYFFSLILGLITCSAFAQQDLFSENPTISPEINADHSVTFRIQAPEAGQVSVTGSLDGEHAFAPIAYDMKKGNDGMWTFTTPVLPSEFYRYHFLVDSVRTVDPANAFAIRDVGNLSNVFVIGGGQADLYEVKEVPHGTVSYRWYDSPGNGSVRRLAVYTPPGYEKSRVMKKARQIIRCCTCSMVLAGTKKPGWVREENPRSWIT